MGDRILLCFYQTYALVLPEALRIALLQKWQQILETMQISHSESLKPEEELFDEVEEKTRWVNECGVPSDKISIENISALLSLSDLEAKKGQFYYPAPGLFINVADPGAQEEQMRKVVGKQFVATSSLAQDFQ